MDNTKNSYYLYDAVFSYAIDKIGENIEEDTIEQTLLVKIGLDENKFFDKLFVPRKNEADILSSLQNTYIPMIIYGFSGSGKTSIINKVIRDYCKSYPDTFVIKFDFKGKDNISDLTKSISIAKWHSDTLRVKLSKALEIFRKSDYEIIKIFFTDDNRNYEMHPVFESIRRCLYNEYSVISTEKSFYEWIKFIIDNHIEKYEEKIQKMINYLRNEDYLFYIATALYDKPIKCIILYDNLDSIISNTQRSEFNKFIRGYSGKISKYVNVIITSRISSITKQDITDYGTYCWNKIQIDYKEFLDNSLLETKIKEFEEMEGRQVDFIEKEAIEKKLEYYQKEKFSKEIFKKRKEFIENSYRSGFLKDELSTDINDFYNDIINIVIGNEHIHTALLELANHDRHWMFRFLINFINDIHVNYMENVHDKGFNNKEIDFIIESYFYHWALSNDKIEAGAYDLVRHTEKWYTTKDTIGCSFTHLLLSLIYNHTNSKRASNSYTDYTTVGDLIEIIKIFGFKPNYIKKRIFYLYSKKKRLLYLIELDPDFSIKSFDDIKYTTNIWLTPRAIYIIEYLSLKFLFWIALYRHNNIENFNGQKFHYHDRIPVTINSIATDLEYLRKIAEMHYSAFIIMRKNITDYFRKKGFNENWFDFYHKLFCIKIDYKHEKKVEDLKLCYILQNHILFLRHQKTLPGFDFITEDIIKQFDKLKFEFQESVIKLIKPLSEDFPKYLDFKQNIDFSVFNKK